MLAAMWKDLAGSGHEYKKTRDSVRIAQVLLDHNPDAFQDYIKIIENLLGARAKTQ